MNYDEYLLDVAAEECSEIAQRISNALRFSLGEVQPGQALTNAERIVGELVDLKAMVEMLEERGLSDCEALHDGSLSAGKKAKRSEDHRVGKGCVRNLHYRRQPAPEKQNK